MSTSASSESTILPTNAPAAAARPVQDMVGSGKAWGLCTAVDLHDCNPDLIRDAAYIKRYVVELCELIDMKRFGECQVVDFGEVPCGWVLHGAADLDLIDQRPFRQRNQSRLPRHFPAARAMIPRSSSRFSKEFFGARRGYRNRHTSVLRVV